MKKKQEENPLYDLAENGIFFFSGLVDNDNCYEAIKFILEANIYGKHNHLNLIINSVGGDINEGFALIDVMTGSKIPVRTTGIGQLSSMGLLIFMAGEKGNRTLTKNTLVMSHQWSGMSKGKVHELISAHKEQDIITKMVADHYKKYTGLKETQIKEILLPASDVYLTAEEALKYKLCDKIANL